MTRSHYKTQSYNWYPAVLAFLIVLAATNTVLLYSIT
jgi:hypothetical protein